jgi:addiction module RelE/StbE family toxin
MKITYSKQFLKTARKLSPKVQVQLADRIELFGLNPLHKQLKNHSLHTPYKGSYSINITGDYRAIYHLVDDQTALFTHIGTHSQLYR